MLKADVKALVFDQYGTVVDMQAGLTAAVSGFLRDKGWDGEPHRFVTWWRRTHFENSMIDALCDGPDTQPSPTSWTGAGSPTPRTRSIGWWQRSNA